MSKNKNDNSMFMKRMQKLALDYDSTQAFANALGVSRQTLGFWLKGERTPDMDMLVKVSKALNKSIDYLVGLSNSNSLDADIQSVTRITGLTERAVVSITDKELNGHIVNLLNKLTEIYDSDGNIKHYLYDVTEALEKALKLTDIDAIGVNAMVGDVDTGIQSGELLRMYCKDIGDVWSRLVLDYLIDDVIKEKTAGIRDEEVK